MMNTTLIGASERISYTIEHRGNCVLITGAVPISAFDALMALVPKRSVMDPNCARVWGANFAFGPQLELDDLRKEGAEHAARRERAHYPHASEAAIKWLAGGERGVSSNAIFTRLTGIDATDGWGDRHDYPHDPADFRRCQLLLEQVPELQILFPRMAHASGAWKNLVEAWPAIIAAMDEETPGWREGRTDARASKAYQLIQTAIGL